MEVSPFLNLKSNESFRYLLVSLFNMKCVFKPFLVLFFIVSISSSPGQSDVPDDETIAEVAIVCSKEVADWADHDRPKTLYYLTRIFWDISARFKTLAKTNISFRVTSVTFINSTEEQPFIENARENNGSINTAKGLLLFSEWISRKMDHFPKFDVALIIIRGKATHTSHAYIGTSCKNTGTAHNGVGLALWNYWGSVHVHGSHALGSLFGAENLEDYADCDGSGYAMDINQHVGLRQFFSPCSDHLIHDFIMSDNATCLKHLNHLSTAPVLDPDFDTALVPHLIQEYCRNLYFEGEVGVIAPEDVSNCKNVRCRWWKSDYEVEFSPLDNTRCGHNRYCFRGTCIEPGSLLVNVGSGKCLQGKSRFTESDSAIISKCPRSSIPTDRFILVNSVTNNESENLVAAYFMSVNYQEIKEKCLRASYSGAIDFTSCTSVSSLLIWEVLKLKNDEVLLRHSVSGKCAKENNGQITLDANCDKENPYFRWKFHLVFPLPGMCSEEICESDLRLHTTLRFEETTQKLALDVIMINYGEPAIAPAVTVTWNTSLKLDPVPSMCAFMSLVESGLTSFKCKLGRLLLNKEKAKYVPLYLKLPDRLHGGMNSKSEYVVTLAASSASYMAQIESVEKTISFLSDIYLEGSNTIGSINPETGNITLRHNFQIHLNGSFHVPNVTAVFELPHSVFINGFPLNFTVKEASREIKHKKLQKPATVTCHPANFYADITPSDTDLEDYFGPPAARESPQKYVNRTRQSEPSAYTSDFELINRDYGQLVISCNSTQVTCTEVICHFDTYTPGLVSNIPFLVEIPMEQLGALKTAFDLETVKVEVIGRLILPDAVQKLQPSRHKPDEATSFTTVPLGELSYSYPGSIVTTILSGIAIILGLWIFCGVVRR